MEEITSIEDLENCLAASDNAPVLLFKHSTVCPISSAAQHRLSTFLDQTDSAPPCYLLKVIEARPVSNAVAEQLGVVHQSPQLLILQDRASVWNASHGGIEGSAIGQALANL